jgi:cell division protein ZapA
MVADEFAEVNQRLRRLEAEVAGLQDSRVTAADRSKNTQAAIVAALNAAAERIESVTKKLNQTVGGGNIAMG